MKKTLLLFVAACLMLAACTSAPVEPDPAITALHAVPEDFQIWAIATPDELGLAGSDIIRYDEFGGNVFASHTEEVDQMLAQAHADGTLPDDVRHAWIMHPYADSNQCIVLFLKGREPLMTGASIASVEVSHDRNTGNMVQLQFDNPGAARFEKVTGENVGRPIAFVLKDRVLSAPVVQAPIPGGHAFVAGNYTEAECQAIANIFISRQQ